MEVIASRFDGKRLNSPNDVVVKSDRIWTCAADGYDPDGTLIGKIRIPEFVSNLTFGGGRNNRLFITGTTSLYAVYVTVRPG
jgi:gluconolactonase